MSDRTSLRRWRPLFGGCSRDPRGRQGPRERDHENDRCQALHDLKVIIDYRGNRLRIGFGIYHDEADVDRLVERLRTFV